MQITFNSSLDTGEVRIMSSKSDNAEIMIGIETDELLMNFLNLF